MSQTVSHAMPSNWVVEPLGSVVDILDSQRVPVNSDERANRKGDVPYYGATGQVGWIDAHLFDEELILLGEDGAPFLDSAKTKAYLIMGKSWVNNHAHVLRGRPGILNRFLMHQLNQVDFRRFVSGTTRLKLPQAPMRQIPLVIAPEAEQARLVDEIEKQFTRLDAAVAALKRIQANLKRYRASVLKAACEGRLVPTEAELARREGRSYEPASELLKRILAERRARWEADRFAKSGRGGKISEDGEWRTKYEEPGGQSERMFFPNREGWANATVGQVSWQVQYGSSAKTAEDPSGIPVLRMGNITGDGRLVIDDLKYLPAKHPEFPELLLEAGDLLFNRTNSAELVGKSAVYLGTPHPCSFASYLIRVKIIPGCDPRYLAICLDSMIGRTWIKSVVSQQVGQANVNGTKLQTFLFPLPPDAEQKRILGEIDRRLSIIDEQEMQIDADLKRAERLRQAILNRAFEGKLVAQDSGDEPASVLLERIRRERALNSSKPDQGTRAKPRRSRKTELVE